jgi:hypothetical protein
VDPITITAAGVRILMVASARAIWRRFRAKKAEQPFAAEPHAQDADGFGARFLKASKKAYYASRKRARSARRRIEAFCAAVKAVLSRLFHPDRRFAPQLSTLCFITSSSDAFSKRESVGLRLPDSRAP